MFWRVLAAAFALIALVGCAGSDDKRRVGAIGEGEAEALSWRGDWTAEAEYQPGQVVTHEGATFVAVTPTTQPPEAKCEADCSWTVMAADTTPANTQPPAPEPQHDVLWSRTGYDGPAELPTPHFVGITDVVAEQQRWQQAVNDWLVDVAPWVIRHHDDGGTVFGDNPFESGSYLVFARGVFASSPGLGKTPTPQGSTPNLGYLVSNGLRLSNIVGSLGARKSLLSIFTGGLPGFLLRGLKGPGVSDYSLTCTLLANGQALDHASMTLTPTGTASATLMASATSQAADTKFSVGCAHNGTTAGPFVRDLRIVALKLH